MKLPTLAQVRKALINAVTGASMLVTLGFIHDPEALALVNGAIALVGAVLHFKVGNAPWGDTHDEAPAA